MIPDADLTLFAPTDAAFEALGEDAVPFLLNNLDVLETVHAALSRTRSAVTSIDAIIAAGSSVARRWPMETTHHSASAKRPNTDD